MKRKRQKVPKERNVFVAAALFRKAGAHTKTNKAKRKREKQDFTENIRTGSSEAEQGAFNPKVEISKFSRFTITLMIHTSQIWVTPPMGGQQLTLITPVISSSVGDKACIFKVMDR